MAEGPHEPRREQQPDRRWHTMTADEAAEALRADLDRGLSDEEVAERRRRWGPNRLREAKQVPWWRVLLYQFKSVVVLLLATAALLSFAFGQVLEGISIVVVIFLNTGIGFFTELRASRAMEALQKLGAADSVVLRDGERVTIPAAEIVPGDVLVLQEGESVTADCRLVESAELQVDEASLTGESMPVGTSVEPLEDEGAPLADRTNMAYKGTFVTKGNAVALVVATGAATEIGRVSELVSEVEEEETPLEQRLDRMGRRLIGVCLGVAAVVFVSGMLQEVEWLQMLEAAIALAIAAVPEGLPAVATITLAVGMQRMARRNALIRRLPAVETLGSATCICTDKTGTLTRGEMALREVRLPDRSVRVTGTGYAPRGSFRQDGQSVEPDEDPPLRRLLVAASLCNNASLARDEEGNWTITGDPTEGALIVGARKAGLEADRLRQRHDEVKEFAFSSKSMMMGTVNADLAEDLRPGGGMALCVKGAPGAVAECCTRLLTGGGVVELGDDGRAELLEQNEEMAADGLRVLAVAYRTLEAVPEGPEDAYRDLVWLGLTGIMDPPREEARQTVRALTRAGIKTVMITGDQPATARKIAEELELAPPDAPVLGGRELAGLGVDELAGRLEDVEVFARVSPEQKLQILEALQKRGEICAMLGDGVNDAVALKSADIGVAMGIKGTDVAKETSDMLLLNDRFATVGAAVHQGRIIYANIKKFIHYLFSCNLSEILTMLVASLLGYPLPLLPLQILWLNLITDVFPALALALEPGEADIMDRPPRPPDAALLDAPTMKSIGGFGLLITASTVTAFLLGTYLEEQGSGGAPPVTMSFLTIAFAQLFHVFNSRKERRPVRRGEWLGNRYVLGAIALTIALQLAAVYVPLLQSVLKTAPPTRLQWFIVAGCSLMPLLVGQGLRWIRTGGEGAAEASVG
jgi:Ca2+-transporting ATPase